MNEPPRQPVIQIFENVYLLRGVMGGRPLDLPLLVGKQKSVLMDTGCQDDVEGFIEPALKQIGLDPTQLTLIVNTHCDIDHQGGNHAMKRLAPQALLCCGDADRDQIEDPQAIIEQRYNFYARDDDGLALDAPTRKWMTQALGAPQQVDLTFRGGERIRLSEDWQIEVLHLPGHSHGHLGLLDTKNRALYGGDAIHGDVYLDLHGKPALCPTYLHVPQYMQTARFIEHLDIDAYVGCHWPVKRGEQIREFCVGSRLFVERAERRLLEALAASAEGKTLRDLCLEVGPQLGDWEEDVNIEMRFALYGNLQDLRLRRLVEEVALPRPLRYQLHKTT